jgi:hypothetical protein
MLLCLLLLAWGCRWTRASAIAGAACTEEFAFEFGKYSPDGVLYSEARARFDWPRFRPPFHIPQAVVRDGSIYTPDAGRYSWYANLVGGTERAVLQYTVTPEDTMPTTGHLPGFCGDSCPIAEAGTDGFAASLVIGPGGRMHAAFVLPDRAFTEPLFYNLATSRRSTVRLEIVINTPGVADGVFRVWVDGLQVGEMYRILYRHYDDIHVRSLVMQSNTSTSIQSVRYWTGSCEVPVQYVLIADVLPDVEVVVMDDLLTDLLAPVDVDRGWQWQDGDDGDGFEQYPVRGSCDACDFDL